MIKSVLLQKYYTVSLINVVLPPDLPLKARYHPNFCLSVEPTVEPGIERVSDRGGAVVPEKSQILGSIHTPGVAEGSGGLRVGPPAPPGGGGGGVVTPVGEGGHSRHTAPVQSCIWI